MDVETIVSACRTAHTYGLELCAPDDAGRWELLLPSGAPLAVGSLDRVSGFLDGLSLTLEQADPGTEGIATALADAAVLLAARLDPSERPTVPTDTLDKIRLLFE